MGLATSQVRLLALTSRKADVEMQIQLNSRRKTMLTRESSELAKLYYAKLQNSKIQYATGNGYADITYDYLMGEDSLSYFYNIAKNGTYSKPSANMILTDNYGRVILSDNLLDVVVQTLNSKGQTSTQSNRTVQSLTIDAMYILLDNMKKSAYTGCSTSGGTTTLTQEAAKLNTMFQAFNSLYNHTNSAEGYKMLLYLYQHGAQNGGLIWRDSASNKYYSDRDGTTEMQPTVGTFYYCNEKGSTTSLLEYNCYMYYPALDPSMDFYHNQAFTYTTAKQLCNVFDYYGYIFSAAFNGSKSIMSADGTTTIPQTNFNVAVLDGDVVYDSSRPPGQRYVVNSNSKYDAVNDIEKLQDGLKSGIYQLVDVASKENGGYSKAHGLAYFETLNYVTEKADTEDRESVTAWYNAAKADLSEKETYWDSEITALSSELNAITTEIESVKTLRKDAIDSTFKWGAA